MTDSEKKLLEISPHQRKILQCLSIFWEQITTQDFYSLLNVLEIQTAEGRDFTAQYITLLLNSLIHKGVVIETKELWGKGFQISDQNLREFLTREAAKQVWFSDAVEKIQTTFSTDALSGWYENKEHNKQRLLRDYRLSIYQKELTKSDEVFKKIRENQLEAEAQEIIVQIFTNPFQNELLSAFNQDFQADVLLVLLNKNIENLQSTGELWDFVRENPAIDEKVKSVEVLESILKGEIVRAKELIGTPQNLNEFLSSVIIAVLEKNYEAAAYFGDEAIKLWRKISNKKKGFPANWQLFFYGLAIYKIDEAKFYEFAEEFHVYAEKHYEAFSAHKALKALSLFLKNNDSLATIEANRITSNGFSDKIIEIILAAIIPSVKLPSFIKEFVVQSEESGYRWLELESSYLLSIKEKLDITQSERVKNAMENLQRELGFEPVGSLIPPLKEWERALNVLTGIAEKIQVKTENNKTAINETRVAWLLNFDRKEVQPVEQKYGKTGWSSGRNIALRRLHERDVNNLTEQDISVVKKAMKKHRDYSYYGSDSFDFDWTIALSTLISHPNLFSMKNPTVNIQLIKSEPNLLIKEVDDNLEIHFDAKFDAEGVAVQKETETRYKIIEIGKHHLEIINLMNFGKLKIPAIGREKLLKAIQPLSSHIAIQSDLEEHFENLPFIEIDGRIHALITPNGEGFHVEFFVKPFGTIPPYFKPGKGSEIVIAELENVRTRTKRDLKNERKLLDEIEELCPFLAQFESGNYEWDFSDAEECLTAMLEMETPRKLDKLTIEWTKGQKLNLLGNVGFDNFSLKVKGKNAWFEVEGEAKINEDLVLSMRELNGLLKDSKSNFIELSDGQFVAITEKLRRHLQSLDTVLDDNQRLHSLRAGILDDFADEIEHFTADNIWKEHILRLENAKKFVPELPATFEAELRPYQIEGYEWLSRLANWGVGACLADDMGLGKTLQALAILVERAERGAALVVAPVSVCRNWVREAARFAPTLNFQLFGDNVKGDRKSIVETVGKYDVLVVSYNLLQSEEELFTNKTFATIVLDEAQAVKNRNTKRSKTVMALQGDFRIITTGTPVENHLGELWNLFNFINSGLLGNYEFFNEKFALPIERNKDDNSRKTLQRLIKPFILRRRKNQVLEDLPAKTEIMLTVEMSAEERAFYESVRREALEKIESENGDAKDKRFRILAELTRLRLACCHPKLVNANVDFGGSKLDLFGEILDELIENKHKALVFSQFVKHLKIIREYLDKKGIAYHYLDGSTPSAVRQERIDSFQRGNGEVFLISLKAGGTGLNLTAADYVIHLDPWWNPAVEDQATDRVHRIGQQRPVTVYRLVTENTVEEKILKLHETKRNLADGLLDGTDSSGKMSADDLLNLIKEL